MLIRHTAVVLLTLGLITAPVAVAAQGPSRVPRIGVIGERSPGDSFLRAFQLGLRELGYTEGQSIVVEYRYAHGALDRVPELAAALVRSGLAVTEHWKVYLPAVLLSFLAMVPAVIVAERRNRMKPVFNAAVLLLALVQFGLYLGGDGLVVLGLLLTLFFVAFNVLEATQPSWISRIAPPHAKGTALGVYNTLQSVGLFLGGVLGGWLGQRYGAGAVSLACGTLALLWLALAATMNPPPLRAVPAPSRG